MKTWDAIIVGGGIIGLSLGLALRRKALQVLIVERGEPGREASHAAAGMLAGSGGEIAPPLTTLTGESARLYPQFVHELQDESGINVDLRDHGTILVSSRPDFPASAEPLSAQQLHALEPSLGLEEAKPAAGPETAFAFLGERSVDPRALVGAALNAARHLQIDISSGTEVQSVLVSEGRAVGIRTDKTSYLSEVVVNCAGAWAGSFRPYSFPVRPVKGQMLAVVRGPALRHVVRAESVYLVPRTDGRLLIGSTLEDAGFNKQTDVNTIQKLFHDAVELVPAVASSKQHEAWAGLRPGTPDGLPILGETATAGYFVATGHFREGILLAPITAALMTELILRRPSSLDLARFSPLRFFQATG
ncbi:MAG: glycine oxidase ThiO [Acidobacteria bacterium]|nr:glycine oxidase ThiO [Acidobacteriota bacterium]